MVGCWLLFSLIITSSFKSSLIAHLTVQGKSRPPDTLAELVNSDGWGWAIEPWLLNGVPLEYLSKHPDPISVTRDGDGDDHFPSHLGVTCFEASSAARSKDDSDTEHRESICVTLMAAGLYTRRAASAPIRLTRVSVIESFRNGLTDTSVCHPFWLHNGPI
ncbi:hypothetical protein O3P69_009995 [Scylla paramamosain]|uniref:Uncharacterized protein n=1 Tax=Scylla paramamosain TaxID=85552 RepID=A0AAW0SP56_SCYPA